MSDEQEKYQYRKSEINQGTSPTHHKYKGSFIYYVIHFGQFLDPQLPLLCSHHILSYPPTSNMDNVICE